MNTIHCKLAGLLTLATVCGIAFGGNSDIVSMRREFRKAVAADPAKSAEYLKSTDPEIRRSAIWQYYQLNQEKSLDVLAKAISDADPMVRKTAAEALIGLYSKKNAAAGKLLEKMASTEKNPDLRQLASASVWPFQREIRLLRDNPSWDYSIATVKSVQLPTTGWKFILDKEIDGHKKGYYKVDCDVSNWKDTKVGWWESLGYKDYDGFAWYRIEFTAPEKIDSNAVELHFGAVDEAAWIWLNGTYLGCHDIGLSGWNVPFDVDCSKELKWNQKNVLIVRVQDAADAGGIWKPITLNVLK